MHVPMIFFETTPLGRIMNRFSKDMDDIDTQLPLFLSCYLFYTSPLIATIIIILMTTPIFITVIIPLGGIYILAQVSTCTSIIIFLNLISHIICMFNNYYSTNDNMFFLCNRKYSSDLLDNWKELILYIVRQSTHTLMKLFVDLPLSGLTEEKKNL